MWMYSAKPDNKLEMEYLVEGKKYNLSYQELREEYTKHIEMSDEEFMQNLPSALHLACIVCFLKETPTYLTLNDTGIIHQLVHLLHLGDTPLDPLNEIREQFKRDIFLAP